MMFLESIHQSPECVDQPRIPHTRYFCFPIATTLPIMNPLTESSKKPPIISPMLISKQFTLRKMGIRAFRWFQTLGVGVSYDSCRGTLFAQHTSES